MTTLCVILCTAFISLAAIPAVLGCGGCDGSSEPCSETRSVTTTESYRSSYRCGWFWRRRRCYRTRYRAVTTSITVNTCCTGYVLVGGNCELNSCGTSKYPDAGEGLSQIVGGIEARENEFPWQARLLRNRFFICGAIILDSLHILTAAHCVDESVDVSGLMIVAGDHERYSLESSQQSRQVSAVTIHEDYDGRYLDADIAVLTLETPLILGEDVREACLPTPYEKFVDESVVISGWGRTDGGSTSNSLMYTRVWTTSTSTCDAIYGSRPNRPIICGTDGRGDTDRSSCHGDSGGPMVFQQDGRFVLIGVTSFVHIRGCAQGRPFGYTEVSSYVDWISGLI